MSPWLVPETWLTGAVAIAALIEAWALVKLYELERRQDERNTRVDLFIDLGRAYSDAEDAVPTQNLLLTNFSTAAIYVEKIAIEVEALSDVPARSEGYMDLSEVLKPYENKDIDVVFAVRRASKPLAVPKIWREGRATVTVHYQAYGRSLVTRSVPFKGKKDPWGGFEPEWKPMAH
jgi:hypothetical protein